MVPLAVYASARLASASLHRRVQPCVARQADDVAHARALAPLQQRRRQNPESPRTMKRVVGQTWRSRVTSSLISAAACLAPSILLGRKHARQHRLAAEHVQRQVAVMVVVGVELRQLLRAVQRHVRGVDVQHQLLRCGLVAGDELLDQHAVQCPGLRACGAVLQAAERRRRGQRLVATDGGLHQHIVAQRLVVVQVLVAAAQAVQALRQQVAQAVADALGVARIGDRSGRRAAQPQVLIDLAQQQQPAIAAQVPAAEVGLNDAPAKAPETRSCPSYTLASAVLGCHRASNTYDNGLSHEAADLL